MYDLPSERQRLQMRLERPHLSPVSSTPCRVHLGLANQNTQPAHGCIHFLNETCVIPTNPAHLTLDTKHLSIVSNRRAPRIAICHCREPFGILHAHQPACCQDTSVLPHGPAIDLLGPDGREAGRARFIKRPFDLCRRPTPKPANNFQGQLDRPVPEAFPRTDQRHS